MWLSSLSLSNDTMEGRILNKTFMRLAERDGLDQRTLLQVGKNVEMMEKLFDGLGFCLSEEGDLLSQWRGYADDARGLSIGFHRDYLERLAEASKGNGKPGFTLQRVEYESSTHESLVEPTYRELRGLIDAGAFKTPGPKTLLDTRSEEEVAIERKAIRAAWSAAYFKVLELFPRLFELKGTAFREEREWRLVSILVRDLSDDCLFRSGRDRIVPYRSFALSDIGIPAIAEVVLGPRNLTPVTITHSMLKQLGFGDVPVRSSAATYR